MEVDTRNSTSKRLRQEVFETVVKGLKRKAGVSSAVGGRRGRQAPDPWCVRCSSMLGGLGQSQCVSLVLAPLFF